MGCPCLDAPFMTPNGIDFFFPSSQQVCCLQSLVADVDMEDLGVRTCSAPFNNTPAEQAEFPEDLKQYVKVGEQAGSSSL